MPDIPPPQAGDRPPGRPPEGTGSPPGAPAPGRGLSTGCLVALVIAALGLLVFGLCVAAVSQSGSN